MYNQDNYKRPGISNMRIRLLIPTYNWQCFSDQGSHPKNLPCKMRASCTISPLRQGGKPSQTKSKQPRKKLARILRASCTIFPCDTLYWLRVCAQNSSKSLFVTIPSSASPFMTATANCPELKSV